MSTGLTQLIFELLDGAVNHFCIRIAPRDRKETGVLHANATTSPSDHKDAYQPSITFQMSSLADQYMHRIADVLINGVFVSVVRLRRGLTAHGCGQSPPRTNHLYMQSSRITCGKLQCLYALCLQSCLKHEINWVQNSQGIFNHLGGYFCNRELACLRPRKRLDGLVVATGVGMTVRFRITLLMSIKPATPSMSTSLTVS